ncbi:beta-ketoacyl synthase N-terminal-like domain-containing protein [Streptomyces sp. NPDC046985]|uniref:beta-ketoacyl synthase N-terminal-like domain-containing protein n=1 Tax=Streptomyces sp. NPDC046985 TaxID=3155377 RepID=UPI0033F93E86
MGTGIRDFANQHPDEIAIESGAAVVSYGALYERIRTVSSFLGEAGVQRDDVVAIPATVDDAYITNLMATLMAGATALPFDPSHPAERITVMLQDSGCQYVVDDAGLADSLGLCCVTSVGDLPPVDLELGDAVSEAAYVLFTSGSTGRPKGVRFAAEGLESLVRWELTRGGGRRRRVAHFAPETFDVSFQEIIPCLASGGRLVVVPSEVRPDPQRLWELLKAAQVERLYLPTAYLMHVAEAASVSSPCASLQAVIVAGEQLVIRPSMRRMFAQHPWCRLVNDYGPTETHVVTSLTLGRDPQAWPDLPPIGEAVPDVKLSIADGAAADTGQLVVHGRRVALGYCSATPDDSTRFSVDAQGHRTYRTGDVVRREGNGFAYLGRADNQVKVSGYRVDPGEIESGLLAIPGIHNAAVVKTAGNSQTLSAFIVPADGAENHDDLVQRCVSSLNAKLPAHMVPGRWAAVDELPMTAHGKVDRKELGWRRTSRPLPPHTYEPPAGEAECGLAEVWADELMIDRVGATDKFADLGGTSLAVLSILTALRKAGRSVTTGDLFSSPTVRELARRMSEGLTPPAADPEARRRSNGDGGEAVAVVGLACRFPGSGNYVEFWESLTAGKDHLLQRGVAADGWVRSGGQVEGIDRFAAEAFGFSPREVRLLDPQHRLFLEECWSALDDAGIEWRKLSDRVGVFAGCGPSGHLRNNLASRSEDPATPLATADDLHLLMYTDKDYLPTHVAHRFDFTGPSVNVNAACATALYAVHGAVAALGRGECDLAVAGAANITLPRIGEYKYEPGMMFSEDGVVRPFDANATGTVFSEGVAAVVLKPLSRAEQDGDRIYGVIEGSAIGNDGGRKAGFSSPSSRGQAEVIRAALDDAGVEPETVSFVEAHGTGTEAGDPIEIEGLARAYRLASRAEPLTVTSIKGNIGHLGWAAGMAGFIKTVLALYHQAIPGTANFESLNPLIDPSLVHVQKATAPWGRQPGSVRRAGVSAIGLGGSNAHVILREATGARTPAIDDGPASGGEVLIPVSHADDKSLRAYCSALSDHVARRGVTPAQLRRSIIAKPQRGEGGTRRDRREVQR